LDSDEKLRMMEDINRIEKKQMLHFYIAEIPSEMIQVTRSGFLGHC
jgi:hypothetical protein